MATCLLVAVVVAVVVVVVVVVVVKLGIQNMVATRKGSRWRIVLSVR